MKNIKNIANSLTATGEMEGKQNWRFGMGSSSSGSSSKDSLKTLLPSSPRWFFFPGVFFPYRGLRWARKTQKTPSQWPQRESAERVENRSIPITEIERGRHSVFFPSVNALAVRRPSASDVTGPGGTIPLQDN